ncbi:hypothetical protein [uncultured Massilia sp.]|uniref:hypothetical protein n=1 Tax=uncultured Massilia sp. TaxID=169973 RepID=UPI0025CD5BF6|nr:hypothetical protein [uncultured Massilia sp.]
MATPGQPRNDGNEQRAPAGQEQRSGGLLPADDAADGRYDVAEEVNADQQSDLARRIGQAPQDPGKA